jgi:hypothetical protein
MRDHRVVRVERTWRGAVLTGASAAKRRQGLHLDLLHRTGYKPQHGDLGERGQREVLTGEAVRVAAADDVMGENSSQVGEEVPSLVPEVHMGSTDIRLCLIGDGRHRSESSPVSVEVIRGMRDGGRSSCLMIAKPRAIEVRRCEKCLCQSNQQMAEPIVD